MELRGKTFLLVGLGRTGRESARFLAQRGAHVVVSDLRSEAELMSQVQTLAGGEIRYRLGGEDASWLDGIDYVVPSPGVPRESLLLRKAAACAIPVLSEIELAYRFFEAPLIAVTGTNGKSTTTTLIGEMIKEHGQRVFLGGNLGVPFVASLEQKWDWGVIEVSSFQLEWVLEFQPRVAVWLNVSEDHLDRYPSFAEYCATKERLFEAQAGQDIAILNREDPRVWGLRNRVRSRVISFGFGEVPSGVFASGSEVFWRDGYLEERFSLQRVRIHGVHNVENIMAAIAAAKCAGVAAVSIQKALECFPGLEHRLEFVRERHGVRYYNDSKGTNVGAVVKSLASFSGPVVLLAGGVDKGGDYAPLQEGVRQKVRRLVLFGAAKEKIARALGGLTETVVVDDLGAAVMDAAAHARTGDVVLLSPACASFDQFHDYAERGAIFRNLVQQL